MYLVHKNFIKAISAFLVIIIILSGCNDIDDKLNKSLSMAGVNRSELEKVLEHYRVSGDKEKYKAAQFLIANMQGKRGNNFTMPQNFLPLFQQIYNFTREGVDKDTIGNWVKREWNTYELKYGEVTQNLKKVNDLETISSDFLINNIDWAFKAWKELPWSKNYTFEQFCESILPYRVYEEPLQPFRETFMKEFAWLKDSVKNITDPVVVCKVLNTYLANKFVFCNSLNRYPIPGALENYQIHAGICEHRYALVISVMRSLGLAVGIDYTPQWTEHAGNHSWLYIIDKNGHYRFFNGGDNDMKLNDSCHVPIGIGLVTKVYRKTYAILDKRVTNETEEINIPSEYKEYNIKDVSSEYQYPQSSLNVELKQAGNLSKGQAWLYAFGYAWDMVPVASAELKNGKANFENVGSNCIYVLGGYAAGNIEIWNNPYLLAGKDEATVLNPDYTSASDVKLWRKYPAQQYPLREQEFAHWMVGAKFQASNNKDFKSCTTIYTIDSVYFHFAEKEVKLDKEYRYYRYLAKDTSETHIAEIAFEGNGISENSKYVSFAQIGNYKIKYVPKPKNTFDGKIDSNFDAPRGSWIAIDFGKPVKVQKIRFLVRNDLNVIEIGDCYELFYFDMGWHSLGQKIADKNYIIYKNVPSNALLLLRDLTKGKEERIFIYKNGKQIWL